jgi:hypothetical protein
VADPIMLPVETDPDQLAEIAFEYMYSAFDGWTPADGNLETWLIRACARIVAEGRDVASEVPSSIMRWYGASVMRIAPIAASHATARATVTVRGGEGYTIPAGFEVLVRTAGDDGVTFVVTEPVTIPRTRTTTLDGEVTLRAVEPGVAGNGFTSTDSVEPLNALEFVETIRLHGLSDGGQDAEDDDAYLARLVDELQLAAPRPILTRDFAVLARRVPGVARALAINNRRSKPEVIKITGAGNALRVTDGASGLWIPIAATATAANVADAFNALSPTPPTPRYVATATGGPLNTTPVTVTLNARERYGPWALAITSGAAASSIEVLSAGGHQSDVERSVSVAPVTAAGEALGSETRRAVEDLLNELREVNFEVFVIEPNHTPIDVHFEAVAYPGEDPGAVRDAAIAALRDYLSPARWGDTEGGDQPEWLDEPVVRYLEVAEALNRVPGLRYIVSLRLARQGEGRLAADVTLAGPAALPRPGAYVDGTVEAG